MGYRHSRIQHSIGTFGWTGNQEESSRAARKAGRDGDEDTDTARHGKFHLSVFCSCLMPTTCQTHHFNQHHEARPKRSGSVTAMQSGCLRKISVMKRSTIQPKPCRYVHLHAVSSCNFAEVGSSAQAGYVQPLPDRDVSRAHRITREP